MSNELVPYSTDYCEYSFLPGSARYKHLVVNKVQCSVFSRVHVYKVTGSRTTKYDHIHCTVMC